MSVYKKIHAVMLDVEYLQKDDHVKFKETNYKAISEEQVTSAVGRALRKHGLLVIPVEQIHKREGNLTTVDVTYKIIDVDTGEFQLAVSSGTGIDTQDKGVGKAMTYAYKYLFLRSLAIPTGEDPDKVSSAELDAKQKKEQEKQVSIASLKAKWKTLGGTDEQFDEWHNEQSKKGVSNNGMDQYLTTKLKEKQDAK